MNAPQNDNAPGAARDVLQTLLLALPGLPLTCACHVLNLATFDFGKVNKVVTRSGREFYSDISIHIQCGWQLSHGDLVLAGSADYRRKHGTKPGVTAADDEEVVLTDRFRALNARHAGTLIVATAEFLTPLRLSLRFKDGHQLDVLPLDSSQDPDVEFWRVMETAGNRVHVVAGPGGLTATDPEPKS